MTHVLIADDHAVVRQGLKQILTEELGIKDIGEAMNAKEIFESVRRNKWDLVILDVTLPDKNGLDVLKELKTIAPRLPVLVLSMHPEEQFAVRFLRAGAGGYMTKESAPEELKKAVQKVLAGGKYLSPSFAETLAADLEPEADIPPHKRLSDREYQILCMLALGKTVSQIGKSLSLSVKTVSTYRSRILEKMKMETTAQLMHYAIKARLLE